MNFEFDNWDDAQELLLEFYRREMQHIEKDTAILKEYIAKVVEWMKSDKRCLLLMGGVGCGKTTMLNAICRMMNYLHYSDISYERKGFQWETAYMITNWIQGDKERYESFKQCEWAAIDDIGQEAVEVSNYGTITYPIRDILLHRYERDLITILSTNCLPKDLTAKYGVRVGDRLAETSFFIVFNEKSYRK